MRENRASGQAPAVDTGRISVERQGNAGAQAAGRAALPPLVRRRATCARSATARAPRRWAIRATTTSASRSSPIVNTWSDINPCHSHFRQRAEEVKRGVLAGRRLSARDAGDVARRSVPEADDDALSQPAGDGDRGAAALLSDRRRVLMGGCDKTTPALLMGAISMNLPAIFVPAGPMLRGDWRGQTLGSGSDVWKYWAEKRAGNLSDEAWREIEDGIARSPGHLHDDGHRVDDDLGQPRRWASRCRAPSSIPAVDSRACAHGRRHRPPHRRDGVGGPEAPRSRRRAAASTTRSSPCWRSAARPTPSST